MLLKMRGVPQGPNRWSREVTSRAKVSDSQQEDCGYLCRGQAMAALETNNLSDLIEVSENASACLRVDELQRETLCLLEKIFRTNKSSFFMADESGKRMVLDRFVTRNIKKDYIPAYAQYYCRLDPMPNGINRPFVERLVTTWDEFIPYKEFIHTEFYNDFYKPQNIFHEMAVHLKSGNRLIGAIGLNRPKDAEEFSSQEKLKAEVIAHILTGGLSRAILAEKLAKWKDMIDSFTQDLPYKGIMVLDGYLHLIYVSEETKKMMPMFSQGEEFDKRASLGLPEELLTACYKLLKNPRLGGSLGTKRQGEDVILESARKRIKACLRLIKSQEGVPLVIIYLDQKDPVFSSCECLGKDGLTRREVEVASLVCEGLRNNEIAERLFISEYTVINHLRAIYEKLGVKNRTSLIHRVIHQEPPEINY